MIKELKRQLSQKSEGLVGLNGAAAEGIVENKEDNLEVNFEEVQDLIEDEVVAVCASPSIRKQQNNLLKSDEMSFESEANSFISLNQ